MRKQVVGMTSDRLRVFDFAIVCLFELIGSFVCVLTLPKERGDVRALLVVQVSPQATSDA